MRPPPAVTRRRDGSGGGARGIPLVMAATIAMTVWACDARDFDRRAPSDVGLSYDALLQRLSEAEVPTRATESSVDQPWTSVPGRYLLVAGDTLQVFVYKSADAAERQANRISPDGTQIGNYFIEWAGPARFYRSGTLLVLYVGANQPVLDALRAVLGPPFAGPVAPT